MTQQPQAGALNPEQVLSMTAAPAAEAQKTYLENRNALTRSQLQNQMELGMQKNLLAQRLAGEKDIAQWHEKAAQIRADTMEKIWDARQNEAESRGRATADRMSDTDLERQNRDILGHITSLHGKIPDFTASDTPQTKFSKLTGALQSAIDGRNKSDANSILSLHTQLDTIDHEHQAAAKNAADVNAPRAMYQMLSTSQNPADQQTAQTLNDMQAGKWVNPATGKKQPAMSLPAAISAAGLGQTFQQVHDQLENQHIALLQQKDPRRSTVLNAYESFAKTNPDAFQSAAQSIVSAQVPPPPGKTFEEQLADAAKAAKGTSGQPAGAPAPVQNPYFLPGTDEGIHETVKNYVPNAEQSAVDPKTLIGMAHAGASAKVDKLKGQLKDLGVTLDNNGRVVVNPTQVQPFSVATQFDAPLYSARTNQLSPAEMLDRHTKGAKIAEQLTQAVGDQQKLGQILSMAQSPTNAPATTGASIPSDSASMIGMPQTP